MGVVVLGRGGVLGDGRLRLQGEADSEIPSFQNLHSEIPHKVQFFLCFFFSGTEHPREDKPNLYYWAEITRQHTQTFNIGQIPKPLMITGHVINCSSCGSYPQCYSGMWHMISDTLPMVSHYSVMEIIMKNHRLDRDSNPGHCGEWQT